MGKERTARHFTVKIPEDLAALVERIRKTRGVSWNRFLAEAIAEKAGREARVEAVRETRGVLNPEDAPEWMEASGAEWVRKVRGEDGRIGPWAT